MIFLKRLFLASLLFLGLTTEMNSGIFSRLKNFCQRVFIKNGHIASGFVVNNELARQRLKLNQFTVRNQEGLTCGVHAVNNLKCFIDGDNDLDLFSKLLFDDCRYKDIYKIFTNNLHVSCENLSNMDIEDALDNIFNNNNDQRSSIIVINSSLDFIKHTNEYCNAYNLNEKSQLFKLGVPQYFLVNIKITEKEDELGHWIPFKFELKDGKIVVTTANSLYNSNVIEYGNAYKFVKIINNLLMS